MQATFIKDYSKSIKRPQEVPDSIRYTSRLHKQQTDTRY